MLRIGVIGDFNRDNDTHTAIEESLRHTGADCTVAWISTDAVMGASLDGFDALWCAPQSPYRSLEGALAGIQFARERNLPFLGTCAGFQHAVIEFARNVLGIQDAASAEYEPEGNELFVSRLDCSLVGKELSMRVLPGSRAFEAYAGGKCVEKYYCNFGLNPAYEAQVETAGMRITSRDEDGGARIVELPGHAFFMGTLFVPQTSSSPGRAHPLIRAFVEAAAMPPVTPPVTPPITPERRREAFP